MLVPTASASSCALKADMGVLYAQGGMRAQEVAKRYQICYVHTERCIRPDSRHDPLRKKRGSNSTQMCVGKLMLKMEVGSCQMVAQVTRARHEAVAARRAHAHTPESERRGKTVYKWACVQGAPRRGQRELSIGDGGGSNSRCCDGGSGGNFSHSDVRFCSRLCANHSFHDGVDVLLQQPDAILEEGAGTFSLEAYKASFSDHDAASTTGLSS